MAESYFYVYVILDPRNNKPIYVGKGCRNRHLQHIQTAKYYLNNKDRSTKETINPKLYNKLIKLLEQGFEIQFEFPFGVELDEITAFEKERELTKSIGLKNLCNLKHGGKGGTEGYDFTEEMNRENSERVKKIWKNKSQEQRELEESKRRRTRENRTPEEKKRISEMRSRNAKLIHERRSKSEKEEIYSRVKETKLKRGILHKPMSEETKEKLRESKRKFFESNPDFVFKNSIPVLKLDPITNEVIERFKTIVQAESTIISTKNVYLRDIIKSGKIFHGYKWVKEVDYIKQK